MVETAPTHSTTVTLPMSNGVDLDAYDEEQVRLMEERCILVSPQDVAYGEESKKTCTFTQPVTLRPDHSVPDIPPVPHSRNGGICPPGNNSHVS